MKLYKRYIRPMIKHPNMQGSNGTYQILIDKWFSEEEAKELWEDWRRDVETDKSWDTLTYDEKFIEIKDEDFLIRTIVREELEKAFNDYKKYNITTLNSRLGNTYEVLD